MTKKLPKYRKKGIYAVVTLPDLAGRRKDHYLGYYGTPESLRKYARTLESWEASGRKVIGTNKLIFDEDVEFLTVNGLILRFFNHIKFSYSSRNEDRAGELDNWRHALRPLSRLFGNLEAKSFGPLFLNQLRDAIASGSWLNEEEIAYRQKAGKPKGVCRNVTNQRIARVKNIFRWAVENELLAVEVFQSLLTVGRLTIGRSIARETAEVVPVPLVDVLATVKYMTPTVRDLVLVQYYGGMRPGEAHGMCLAEIDRSKEIWVYRPIAHKMAFRGHKKTVFLGPKAQEILSKYLNLPPDQPIFSPKRSRQESCSRRRSSPEATLKKARKKRKKQKPIRSPNDRFTTKSYARAVSRAIKIANKSGESIPHWHPHQLRHLAATETRREFGLDAARARLGHRTERATERYAKQDGELGAKVARVLG